MLQIIWFNVFVFALYIISLAKVWLMSKAVDTFLTLSHFRIPLGGNIFKSNVESVTQILSNRSFYNSLYSISPIYKVYHYHLLDIIQRRSSFFSDTYNFRFIYFFVSRKCFPNKYYFKICSTK